MATPQPPSPDRAFVPQVDILPRAADVARAAADQFAAAAHEAIGRSRRFTVALAGGNTPRAVYAVIADNERSGRRRLPWGKIHIFFGDERVVPPEDAASNYRMARESLLESVPIPAANVHRIRAELGAVPAADEYERELRAFFAPQSVPSFDLVLLGMGPDGHTASLFPGTTALAEGERLVVANWVEQQRAWRVTLTFAVLNHAARVLFLVVGSDKAAMLQRVLAVGATAEIYPAQRVRPRSGQLRWILDQDAARLLPPAVNVQLSAD